jgi:pilus assembly protein CpaB
VSRYQRRTVPGRNANSAPDHGTMAMANDNSAMGRNAPAVGQATGGRSDNAGVRVARGRSVDTGSTPGAPPMGNGN